MSHSSHHLELELKHIIPNPNQPRKRFDPQSLQRLAQSIQTQGIIQPLVVRPTAQEGRYEIVAGERRWRALKLAKVQKIPVIVKDISDADLLEVALLENIQRENLSPIEEGASYQQLIEDHSYTQETLAHRVGKDRSTIANLMRLLMLPPAIQNDLEEQRLSVGHARCLLALPSEAVQLEMRELLLKKQWSVRETEKQVKLKLRTGSIHHRRSASKNPKEHASQIQQLQSQLEQHLKTKVTIQFKNGKGSIKVDYYSLDQFDHLYEQLLKP